MHRKRSRSRSRNRSRDRHDRVRHSGTKEHANNDNNNESARILTEEEAIEARQFAERMRKIEEAANVKIAKPVNNIADTQFVSKAEREAIALERLADRRMQQQQDTDAMRRSHDRFVSGETEHDKMLEMDKKKQDAESEIKKWRESDKKQLDERDTERKMIHEAYFGKKVEQKKLVKPSEKFSRIFKMEWDLEDDTSAECNQLYAHKYPVHPMLGRGFVGGIDRQQQLNERTNFVSAQSSSSSSMAISDNSRNSSSRDPMDGHLVSKGSGSGHWSEKPLSLMSSRDWRIFREDFDIRIKGGRAALPMRAWAEQTFPDPVTRAIADLGFAEPTPIQRQGIPTGLERKDIVGVAETGSGKTMAYAIPLLCYILSLPESVLRRCGEDGPLGLIMVPVRELAQQIEDEMKKLCKYTRISAVSVVGGQSIEDQGFKFCRGVEIVIGTPGRLLECIELRYLVLNQCNYIILDEADRMIALGFEEDVNKVMGLMGSMLKSDNEDEAYREAEACKDGLAMYRVTSMFSATMSPEIMKLSKSYLRHPVIVSIGDEETSKNKRIKQIISFMSQAQKRTALSDLLSQAGSDDKIIIFVNTKIQADHLSRQIQNYGFSCGILHGGKTQDQRESVLSDFKTGEYSFMIATDVASRGLDIPDITHVVNYDMPATIETYTHRIGRTGRAGKDGIALSYVCEETDGEILFDLKNYLTSTGSMVPPQLLNHPMAQASSTSRNVDA